MSQQRLVLHCLASLIMSTCAQISPIFAQESACSAPEPFQGYWGGGKIHLRERLMGIPILATTRFSYRQIRYSPCSQGVPVLPPGIGEATIQLGIPIIDNRRGGWLVQLGAYGQGSQRQTEAVKGLISGTPAMSGHVNLWQTPWPLIQFTGAVSAVLTPQSSDAPLSIAYLGGARMYLFYAKRAQINLGFIIGGSNGGMNVVPSLVLRLTDFAVLGKKTALGVELRAPIDLFAQSVSLRWRLWGALTLTIERVESKSAESQTTQSRPTSNDLIRSRPASIRPAQTAWETTL